MEVETVETEEGTEIKVSTSKEVAVVVQDGEEERIYLPEVPGDDSTYYAEATDQLMPTQEGYTVTYPGEPEDITVLG